MSALAVANHMFSYKHGQKVPKSAEVKLEIKAIQDKTVHIYHTITKVVPIIKIGSNTFTGVAIDVKTNDGSVCTITVRRKTDGNFKQGEEVIATHSVQHIAGLEEHYELGQSRIWGYHRGSKRYGGFKVRVVADGEAMVMLFDIRGRKTGNWYSRSAKIRLRIQY